MSLVRMIARPLLAAKFIVDGVDHVRHPDNRAEPVAPLVTQVANRTKLPDDPELIVRVNGALMATAGTLLALGKAPRVSASVLALTVLPATFADYAFWREDDYDRKVYKRRQFFTNLGTYGGVLLATVDTAGQPGLVWRGNRAMRDAQRAANLAQRDAKRFARTAKREAQREAALTRAKVEAALA